MDSYLRKLILPKEEDWCNYMNYSNPYLDPYDHHITNLAVVGDRDAYIKFPDNKHVYDKLFVAKSQDLACGQLEELKGKENIVNYPIFIKPRYGHLSAASKNCYKIKNPQQLKKYIDYPTMMWSEFIDGTEGMTDYITVNGRIVWQITYIYSDEQQGFADTWKYVSPDTPAPKVITEWVKENINNHTGFINIQYRNSKNGPKIIEAGLRPARSGMYIIAADVPALSKNIYNVHAKHFWDHQLDKEINFQPFYVYKCFCKGPIFYIWPHNLMEKIISCFTDMPLREYYWEPVNGEGIVFYQFMTRNHEEGMKTKSIIELLFAITQLVFAIFIAILVIIFFKAPLKIFLISFTFFSLIWLTRFLNPIYVNFNLWKAFKQMYFGESTLYTQEQFDKDYENNHHNDGE